MAGEGLSLELDASCARLAAGAETRRAMGLAVVPYS